MPATVILGTQFGDEGKGKVTDVLSDKYDVVVRYQGGANAGHTLFIENTKIAFHHIPSGIVRNKISILGNGMVINPPQLIKEMDEASKYGFKTDNIKISRKANVVMPYHKDLDSFEELSRGNNKVGTTKQGIGPTYIDKVARTGIRMEDLLNKESLSEKLSTQLKIKRGLYNLYEQPFKYTVNELLKEYMNYGKILSHHMIDSDVYINDMLMHGKRVLLEGAQGVFLDVDHGTYPYVTSSNTTIGGAITGSGIAPQYIKRVIGIMKAYTTRVGEGPFPTELKDGIGIELQKKGHEFGTTTNRPRRCGWGDLVIVKTAVILNGITDIAITKVDTLADFDEIKLAVAYKLDGEEITHVPSSIKDMERVVPVYKKFTGWKELTDKEWNAIKKNKNSKLPKNLLIYLKFIEKYLQIPIKAVSYGPKRDQIILNPSIR